MMAERGRPVAHDVARELGRRIGELARELLPGGHREGGQWRADSTSGDRGRALSVELHGERAGLWIDHRGGTERGDALDLVAACRYGGDLRAAYTWALTWLGWSDRAAPAPRRPAPPPENPATEAAEAEAKRRRALALWLEARPAIAGTPVDCYLKARGIDLATLGRQPRALRYHPALWNAESGRKWDAMVAAVRGPDGKHVATHRTWLALVPRPGTNLYRWTKAPLEVPKKVLGSIGDGFIPLWRGASGKPLREAPAGDTIVIAEGIETALSVAVACPEYRVISAISLGGLARVALPPAIGTVILAYDNDPPPPRDTPPEDRRWGAWRKQRAARRAAALRYAREGRTVKVAWPPVPGADWNDILQGVEG